MSANAEDRAYQIHQKTCRERLPVYLYVVNGKARATVKAGGFGGATNDNLCGVYNKHAELVWIEDDLNYMGVR